jgi:hypothetical protein
MELQVNFRTWTLKSNKMNWRSIKVLQKEYHIVEMQTMIDSGQVWLWEGSYGRTAMDYLESGLCMLPKKAHKDYYGNRVPSRDDIKAGTKGSYKNCFDFWNNPMNYMDLAS